MLRLILLAAPFVLTACVPQAARLVQVVDADSSAARPEREAFVLIADTVDLAPTAYVGRLRAVVTHEDPSTLDRVFPQLRREANALGANGYRVESRCGAAVPCDLVVAVYDLGDDPYAAEGWALPADAVVVFGDLRARAGPTGFSLDGTDREAPAMGYVLHQNGAEGTRLAKGGLGGARVSLRAASGRDAQFFTLAGFAVGPGATPGGGLGISFNTGRITPVDRDFGAFLVAALPAPGAPTASEPRP